MNASDSQRHNDPSRREDDLPIETNEDVNSEANIPNRLSVTDILRTLLEETQHDYNSDSNSDLYTPNSTDSPTTQAGNFSIGMDHETEEEEDPPLIDKKSEDDQEAYSEADTPPNSSPPLFPSTIHPSALPPYLFLLGSAAAARERRASAQAHVSPSAGSDAHSSSSEADINFNESYSDPETDLASYNGHDEGVEEDIGIDEDYSDPFGGLEIEDEERRGRHELTVVQLVRRFRDLVREQWDDMWPGAVNPFEWGVDGEQDCGWEDEECLGGYMRFPYEGFEGAGDDSGDGRGLLV